VEYKVLEFLEDDRSPYAEWFNALDAVAAARVDRYVRRMEQGNLGTSRSVGQGVQELKIDYGPGCRVYYGRDGAKLVILLGGGSKKRQTKDIRDAQERWARYKTMKKQEDKG
jgi:putative addiction module killer protein